MGIFVGILFLTERGMSPLSGFEKIFFFLLSLNVTQVYGKKTQQERIHCRHSHATYNYTAN